MMSALSEADGTLLDHEHAGAKLAGRGTAQTSEWGQRLKAGELLATLDTIKLLSGREHSRVVERTCAAMLT